MSVFIDLFDFIFEPLEILLSHIGITNQTLADYLNDKTVNGVLAAMDYLEIRLA